MTMRASITGGIWEAWFYLVFTVMFLLLLPLFYVLLSREKWYPAAHRLRVFWGRVLFGVMGIRMKIRYEEPARGGPFIVVANHASYLDIPCCALAVPGYLRYMAKTELSRIPLFGIFFRTIDIPIDRSDKEDWARAYRQAGEYLDKKQNIVIFPEGGITGFIPKLAPFRMTPFRLAAEKKVSILPVTLLDNWQRLPGNRRFAGSPGQARVVVHRKVAPSGTGEEEVKRLRDEVRNTIKNCLGQ